MSYESILIIHPSSAEREALQAFVTDGSDNILFRAVATEPEAEQIIGQQQFDVILSSLFLESFSRLSRNGTHIIALIPDESKEQMTRLEEHGLSHFQVFPVRVDDLQDQLNSMTRDGIEREHPRFDVSGTKILFDDDALEGEGKVHNISEGGFLCEMVLSDIDSDIPREVIVTIKFPKKFGNQVIENIHCNYLTTRKTVKEGSRVRRWVVMLFPKLKAHHFEALVLTFQKVIKRQHPLFKWNNGRLEVNYGGRRTYYNAAQLLRLFLVFLLLLGLVGGSSYYLKVPESVWLPDRPEIKAVVPKDPGPQINPVRKQIVFKEKIRFEKGNAIIRAESYDLLNKVASVIRANLGIKRISIDGHTDSDGSVDFNRVLSGKRADAVRAYLVDQGISGDILQAVGYGESRPLTGNTDENEKQINRRVEFTILEQQ